MIGIFINGARIQTFGNRLKLISPFLFDCFGQRSLLKKNVNKAAEGFDTVSTRVCTVSGERLQEANDSKVIEDGSVIFNKKHLC